MTVLTKTVLPNFAKKSNAVSQSTEPTSNITTTPTTITKSTQGNPILGFDAAGKTLYAGDSRICRGRYSLSMPDDTSTGDSYVMPEWVCYTSRDMKTGNIRSIMSATDVSWDQTIHQPGQVKLSSTTVSIICTCNLG